MPPDDSSKRILEKIYRDIAEHDPGDTYSRIEIEINNRHSRRTKSIAAAIAAALRNLGFSSSP